MDRIRDFLGGSVTDKGGVGGAERQRRKWAAESAITA